MSTTNTETGRPLDGWALGDTDEAVNGDDITATETVRPSDKKIAAAEALLRAARFAGEAEHKRPVYPSDFTGTAREMEANASAYVSWWLATVFDGAITSDKGARDWSDESLTSAAVRTRESAEKVLYATASQPPRSSDWLALPRWAAEVAAYAAVLQPFSGTAAGGYLRTLAFGQ